MHDLYIVLYILADISLFGAFATNIRGTRVANNAVNVNLIGLGLFFLVLIFTVHTIAKG